jgi:hypothetical protein
MKLNEMNSVAGERGTWLLILSLSVSSVTDTKFIDEHFFFNPFPLTPPKISNEKSFRLFS